MPNKLDTHQYNDSLAGAVYFAVGRGTEGGSASYHLSIAGITEMSPAANERRHWGDRSHVAADSGYSVGAIQVDLGKRGEWPLGAISGRPLKSGETTYVDAIIQQSEAYAKEHGLAFNKDHKKLRGQLLSHGKGLQFIDAATRDCINAWASSDAGSAWIHKNIDVAQVKGITMAAVDTLNAHGKAIAEPDRFEAICAIAKTYNQLPAMVRGNSKAPGLVDALDHGADLKGLKDRIAEQKHHYGYLASGEAVSKANQYETALGDDSKGASMLRAQQKVVDPAYRPSGESKDADIQTSLAAIGLGSQVRARASSPAAPSAHANPNQSGQTTVQIQSQLNQLGYTGLNRKPLDTNANNFGPNTDKAVKEFQGAHNMPVTGVVDSRTAQTLQQAQKHPLVSETGGREHALYSRIRQLCDQYGGPKAMGINGEVACERFLGALTAAAKDRHITQPDAITPGTKGDQMILLQGVGHDRVYASVSVSQGIRQPLEQSTQMLIQLSHNQA